MVAALATYVAMAVLAFIGSMIGQAVPCTGKLCELGRVFQGAAVGILVALALMAYVGHRIGMRWWFVPTILAVAIGSLGLADLLADPASKVFVVVALAAPVIGAVVASGRRPA